MKAPVRFFLLTIALPFTIFFSCFIHTGLHAQVLGVYGSDTTNTLAAMDHVGEILFDNNQGIYIFGQQERTLTASNGQVYEYGAFTQLSSSGNVYMSKRLAFRSLSTAAWLTDGNLIVAGAGSGFLCTSGMCKTDMLVAKVDINGVPVWGRSFGNPVYNGSDGVNDVQELANGDVLVVGNMYESSQNSNAFIARLNASTGDTVWTKAVGTSSSQRAASALEASNGEIYVACEGSGGAMLAKLSATGQLLWAKGFTNYGDARRIFELTDGSFTLVADFLENNDYKILLINLSSSGVVNWAKKVEYVIPNHEFFVAEAYQDAAENIYITGTHYQTQGYTGPHVYFIKADNAGNLLWAKQDTMAYAEGKTIQPHPAGGVIFASDYTSKSGGYSFKPDIWLIHTADDGFSECLQDLDITIINHAQTVQPRVFYSFTNYETQPTTPYNNTLTMWKKDMCLVTTLDAGAEIIIDEPQVKYINGTAIQIQNPWEDGVWKIHDMSGREVMNGLMVNGYNEFPVSAFTPGVYMILLQSGEKTYTERFVK